MRRTRRNLDGRTGAMLICPSWPWAFWVFFFWHGAARHGTARHGAEYFRELRRQCRADGHLAGVMRAMARIESAELCAASLRGISLPFFSGCIVVAEPVAVLHPLYCWGRLLRLRGPACRSSSEDGRRRPRLAPPFPVPAGGLWPRSILDSLVRARRQRFFVCASAWWLPCSSRPYLCTRGVILISLFFFFASA